MSDEIQQNRYDQLVRRVAGIIGPGSKVAQVITELFPMIDVENLPSELLILSGTSTAFRSTDIMATPGSENASQLSNPEDSGKIITITQLVFSISIDATVNITRAFPLLSGSNGFGEFRDSRSGAGPSVGNTRVQQGVVINPGITFAMQANEIQSLRDDNDVAVLVPGDSLTVGTLGLAARLIVIYFWRERAAQQSELNI
jgi:hypothetical protein